MHTTIKQANYTFSKDNAPVASVPGGSVVKFESLDALGGQITRENAQDGFKNFDWNAVNPATGPLFVEGAVPGDVLRVEIMDIRLTSDAGVLLTGSALGLCKEFFDDNIARVVDIKGGYVEFSPDIKIPVRPMIGVIGTAPAGEPVNNGTPGEHGGNMDCREIIAGAAVYLPVNVEGALLSMGDVHAAMADGESCGTGAETTAEITVKVDVLKDCVWPTPFVESAEHYMPLASAATADEAISRAVLHGVDFLMTTRGMSRYDAITFISLAADVRICQVVDPLITARVNIPKSLI
ncbi:MAG: acetamidase/formamidase family protein [Defluviitaleaceae bacterium]|nr:acetamidase/formamidase family protein [Defluviitaleaceae bacterium]